MCPERIEQEKEEVLYVTYEMPSQLYIELTCTQKNLTFTSTELCIPSSKSIIIGSNSIYRPPGTVKQGWYELLEESITAQNSGSVDLYFLGDFNSDTSKDASKTLLDRVKELGLQQLIHMTRLELLIQHQQLFI